MTMKPYFKPAGWPSCRELLEIAASANPPDDNPSFDYSNQVLDAKDGWKVDFRYRGGELQYVNEFIRPDGAVFDPWHRQDMGGQSSPLKYWSSVSDMVRLEDYIDECADKFESDPVVWERNTAIDEEAWNICRALQDYGVERRGDGVVTLFVSIPLYDRYIALKDEVDIRLKQDCGAVEIGWSMTLEETDDAMSRDDLMSQIHSNDAFWWRICDKKNKQIDALEDQIIALQTRNDTLTSAIENAVIDLEEFDLPIVDRLKAALAGVDRKTNGEG